MTNKELARFWWKEYVKLCPKSDFYARKAFDKWWDLCEWRLTEEIADGRQYITPEIEAERWRKKFMEGSR